MSGRISRTGLLIILAFLVPVIVELRTLAGFVGVALSTTQYVVLAAALVVAALGAIALWNLRVDLARANGSGGT